MKKVNFFLYYILLSISILFLAFRYNDFLINRIIILGIIGFFVIALREHFYEIKSLVGEKDREDRRINYENLMLIIGTSLSAVITWYINHELGYGPIIANGLVGVVVATLFSAKKAGAFYIASFVGMSGLNAVSSMTMAGVIGLIVGIVIIFSQEIYAGIGGKGGTIAALSTQLIRIIMSFFV